MQQDAGCTGYPPHTLLTGLFFTAVSKAFPCLGSMADVGYGKRQLKRLGGVVEGSLSMWKPGQD